MRPLIVQLALVGIALAQQHENRATPINTGSFQTFERHPKFAILVGVGDYPVESDLPPLSFPALDVSELAVELNNQGYKVIQLVNKDATLALVRGAFKENGQLRGLDQGTLLFYFSGHGFEGENGENYLVTRNVTRDSLEREGLRLGEVQQLVRASHAKRQILWIDACRTATTSRYRGYDRRTFTHFDSAEGMRVLYSTAPGAVSFEDEQLRHGVFTYYLLQGLRGQAAGSDGLVTFEDLATYLAAAMSDYGARTHRVQKPFQTGDASGDFLLSDTSLSLPATPPSDNSADILFGYIARQQADAFYEEKNYVAALPLYKQAAASGDPAAMRVLGHMYHDGTGVPQNPDAAANWYRKAAELDDAQAMNNLGYLYANGDGVDQENQEAMNWIRKAAEKGSIEATFNLGVAYDQGKLIPQNYKEAMKWYRQAADKGNSGAMVNIAVLYATGRGVQKDPRQAVFWARKAAAEGNQTAINLLRSLGLN